MNTRLSAIALAAVLTASTASAFTPLVETRTPQTQQTAPNVFGSTTTHERANAKPPAVNARQAQKRALNVQIRTVQRQYLNLRRAGDPRAEQVRVELERLKAEQRRLYRR